MQFSRTENKRAEERAVFTRNVGKFEKLGSTYIWDWIYPDGSMLPGYSKPVGMPEKSDKKALLADVIRRLIITKRYLDKAKCMVFYRQYRDGSKERMFTLTRTGYDPCECIFQHQWLLNFLTALYPLPELGQKEEMFPEEVFPTDLVESELKRAEELIPKPKPAIREHEYFDVKKRFHSLLELRTYAYKGKEIYKWTQEPLDAYIRQVRENHRERFRIELR